MEDYLAKKPISPYLFYEDQCTFKNSNYPAYVYSRGSRLKIPDKILMVTKMLANSTRVFKGDDVCLTSDTEGYFLENDQLFKVRTVKLPEAYP